NNNINPPFNPPPTSIASDPNAAAIEAVINSVIQGYQNFFSPPNAVSVTIRFQEVTTGLASSLVNYVSESYTDYRNALNNPLPNNPALAPAWQPFPNKPNNPVTGNANAQNKAPAAHALGFGNGNSDEETINLNMSIINVNRTGGSSSNYDLTDVV